MQLGVSNCSSELPVVEEIPGMFRVTKGGVRKWLGATKMKQKTQSPKETWFSFDLMTKEGLKIPGGG